MDEVNDEFGARAGMECNFDWLLNFANSKSALFEAVIRSEATGVRLRAATLVSSKQTDARQNLHARVLAA